MARREWALKKVENAPLRNGEDWTKFAARLVTAEHAWAVSIVKRAKALQLRELRDTDTNEFLGGYEAACVDILAALSKGRA